MPENKDNQRERIKLLLVDDEVSFVNVLSNRMAKRNIDVSKALSGTQGIQALRKNNFDVSVLDLKMEDRVIKMLVPGVSSLAKGEELEVIFDPRKMHLFDQETERAIV